MPDTVDAYDIGQDWVNINELILLPVGESLLLQNVGIPGDVISLALSDAQPDKEFIGVALDQLNPMQVVESATKPLWARFYRFDNLEPYPSRKGLLQIQPLNEAITPFFKSSTAGDDITNLILQNNLVRAINAVEFQLKLLNARFEENFETGITEVDL